MHELMHELQQKIEKLESQHSDLAKNLEENTKLTTQVAADQKEILQFFNDFKVGLRFLGYIASVCKWIATVGAGIAASAGLYHLVKSGTVIPPK